MHALMRSDANLVEVSPGAYRWLVPSGWGQARGTFGGLILANLVSALQLDPEQRPLRTFTANFCGPVLPGEAMIAVKPLRVGKGQSTLACLLIQNEQVQAHGVAVAGRDRPPDTDFTSRQRPSWPAWEELPDTPTPNSVVPEFTQHYRFRTLAGTPFSGGVPETATPRIPRTQGQLRTTMADSALNPRIPSSKLPNPLHAR